MKVALFQEKLTPNSWVKVFENLHQQGHQVQGFTFLGSQEYQGADVMPEVRFPVKQIANYQNWLVKRNRRRLANLLDRAGWAVPGLNLYWDGPLAACRLYQEIVRGDYDIVVSGDPLGLSAAAIALAARKKRIPYVAKVARNRCFLRRHRPLPFYPQPSLRSQVFRQIDVFSAHTREQIEVLAQEGVPREKIVKIDYPVDTKLFRPFPAEQFRRKYKIALDSFLILYIGRLIRLKGVDILIRGFAQITKEYPDAVLVIVGAGPAKKSLRELARSLCPQGKILFTGPIANTKLPGVYNSADLFVYPGVSWAGMEEQGAMVVAEASACRVPAIITKVGGVPECHPESFLIEPGSVLALKNAIKFLKDNPAKRRQIADKSYRYVLKTNSLDKITRQYQALFKKLKKSKGYAR